MALNSSGPISLAGTTAGQSIEIELGGTGTTQISLNDATVRALAGVASGQITMPTDFYGKSSVSYYMMEFAITSSSMSTYTGFEVDSSGNTYINGYASIGSFLAKFDTSYSPSFVYQYTPSGASNTAQNANSLPNSLFYNSTTNYLYCYGANGTYMSFWRFDTSGNVSGIWNVNGTTYTNTAMISVSADSSGYMYSVGTGQFYNGTCAYASIQAFRISGTGSFSYGQYVGPGTGNYQSSAYSGALGPSSQWVLGGYFASLRYYNTSGSMYGNYCLSTGCVGVGSGSIYGLSVDSSSNVYGVWGATQPLYTGIFKITSSYSYSIVFYNFGTGFSYSYQSYPTSVLDSSGNLYVTLTVYSPPNTRWETYILKFNSSLTLQWQRVLYMTSGMYTSGTGGNVIPSLFPKISGGFLYCLWPYLSSTSYQRAISMKLPLDGSKTGTYSIPYSSTSAGDIEAATIVYAASSISTSSRTTYLNNIGGSSSSVGNTATSKSATRSSTTYYRSSAISI